MASWSSFFLGGAVVMMFCIFVLLAFIARELSAIHAGSCQGYRPPPFETRVVKTKEY